MIEAAQEYMTVPEAAERRGVGVVQTLRAIRAGKLEAFYSVERRRYLTTEAWVAEWQAGTRRGRPQKEETEQ